MYTENKWPVHAASNRIRGNSAKLTLDDVIANYILYISIESFMPQGGRKKVDANYGLTPANEPKTMTAWLAFFRHFFFCACTAITVRISGRMMWRLSLAKVSV